MEEWDTPEILIGGQLTACLAAMQDCLDHARGQNDRDTHGHLRRDDLACFAGLMKASARLTEALARLRGQTRHDIRVWRGAPAQGDGSQVAGYQVARSQVDRLPVDKGEG
jgi:hypothetical protein